MNKIFSAFSTLTAAGQSKAAELFESGRFRFESNAPLDGKMSECCIFRPVILKVESKISLHELPSIHKRIIALMERNLSITLDATPIIEIGAQALRTIIDVAALAKQNDCQRLNIIINARSASLIDALKILEDPKYSQLICTTLYVDDLLVEAFLNDDVVAFLNSVNARSISAGEHLVGVINESCKLNALNFAFEKIDDREMLIPELQINLYKYIQNPFEVAASFDFELLKDDLCWAIDTAAVIKNFERKNVGCCEDAVLCELMNNCTDIQPISIKLVGIADLIAAFGCGYSAAKAVDLVYNILTFAKNISGQTDTNSCVKTNISADVTPVSNLFVKQKVSSSQSLHSVVVDQQGAHWQEKVSISEPFSDYLKSKGKQITNIPEELIEEMILKSPYGGSREKEIAPIVVIEMQKKVNDILPGAACATIAANEISHLLLLQMILKNKEVKRITIQTKDSYVAQPQHSARNISVTLSPVRPTELTCDVVRFQIKKERWIAFIGLNDGRPYEIFTGLADDDEGFFLPKSVTEGKIIKTQDEFGHRRYDFQFKNSRGYKTTVEGLSHKFNKEYWNYAKLISGVLRLGMPIDQVIKLVSGLDTDSESINNWTAGVERALKKYVVEEN